MILVTGGTGHTGRRAVTALADRGERVRVLTREPAKLALKLRRRVDICRGSLDDPAVAREAFDCASAVIAMTHIGMAPRVVAAAREAGVRRAIFISSTRRFTKFPEETARRVIEGEQAVRDSGLDWTIIRPSMIYGSGHDNNFCHLQSALRHWPVHPLIGGGRMLWQPVFTWDVVQAVLAALDRSATIGKEYTVAGPEPISYEQMVRTFLRLMNRRVLLVPVPMPWAKAAVRLYGKVSKHPRVRLDQIQRLEEDKVFDITDARRDLGFAPVSFEEGIRRKLAYEV
jgi:uncharacterized protein YbjT (DUF2867 family)